MWKDVGWFYKWLKYLWMEKCGANVEFNRLIFLQLGLLFVVFGVHHLELVGIVVWDLYCCIYFQSLFVFDPLDIHFKKDFGSFGFLILILFPVWWTVCFKGCCKEYECQRQVNLHSGSKARWSAAFWQVCYIGSCSWEWIIGRGKWYGWETG